MTSSARPRLLIDGIGLLAPGAASPWLQFAPWLAAEAGIAVFWLDRCGLPPAGQGSIRGLPFPRHRKGACAADSLLIQQVCELHAIDCYASTGWTTPLAVPQITLVDAHTLAALADGHANEAPHAAQERVLVLAFARRRVAASQAVQAALAARLPELAPALGCVATVDWSTPSAQPLLPESGGQIAQCCVELAAEARAGAYARFFSQWRSLRELQHTVDV